MMKLDMELKQGDVVLLKFLACVVIAFFMARFLILPGIEKHQSLVIEKEQVTQQKEQMETIIANAQQIFEKNHNYCFTLPTPGKYALSRLYSFPYEAYRTYP